MSDRPRWQRGIALTLILVAFALWIASLVWVRSRPDSLWWWVLGPALALVLLVETVMKLRKRATPLYALPGAHLRYVLLSVVLLLGGASGLIRPESTGLARFAVGAIGAVMLVAGARDFAGRLAGRHVALGPGDHPGSVGARSPAEPDGSVLLLAAAVEDRGALRLDGREVEPAGQP